MGVEPDQLSGGLFVGQRFFGRWIADIDTPETYPARCAEEQRLGDAATARLHALLNAGPVTLLVGARDVDRYGRQLRVVERGGVSLGQVLVDDGLARPWEGRRRPWCGAV